MCMSTVSFLPLFLIVFLSLFYLSSVQSQQQQQQVINDDNDDIAAMETLKWLLNVPSSFNWTNPDPCQWQGIQCNSNHRVTSIKLNNMNLTGWLPDTLNTLTSLQLLDVSDNKFFGGLPTLSRLASLQTILLHNNTFFSMSPDFFDGLTCLQTVSIGYNDFAPGWEIPDSIISATSLKEF